MCQVPALCKTIDTWIYRYLNPDHFTNTSIRIDLAVNRFRLKVETARTCRYLGTRVVQNDRCIDSSLSQTAYVQITRYQPCLKQSMHGFIDKLIRIISPIHRYGQIQRCIDFDRKSKYRVLLGNQVPALNKTIDASIYRYLKSDRFDDTSIQIDSSLHRFRSKHCVRVCNVGNLYTSVGQQNRCFGIRINKNDMGQSKQNRK